MTKSQIDILRTEILIGTQVSFQRLIEQTKKEDGYLVVSKDGKVARIKARDLKESSLQ